MAGRDGMDHAEVSLHLLPFECRGFGEPCWAGFQQKTAANMSKLRSQFDLRSDSGSLTLRPTWLGHCSRRSSQQVPLTVTPRANKIISGSEQVLITPVALRNAMRVGSGARNALVGVDIEHDRRVDDALSIAHRYFAREEADMLAEEGPGRVNEAFLRLWVCKESFVKAIGLGLSYPLTAYEWGPSWCKPHYTVVEEAHGPASDWTLRTTEVDRSYLAVAVRS